MFVDFEVGKDELWLGPRYFAHCNNNSTVESIFERKEFQLFI